VVVAMKVKNIFFKLPHRWPVNVWWLRCLHPSFAAVSGITFKHVLETMNSFIQMVSV